MRRHDLVIIGTGSGNIIIDGQFADHDVAIISAGPFGGTCLNVGCIPSKIFAHSAEVANEVRTASTFDVDAELRAVHWARIRDRVFGRIDPMAADGQAGREQSENITVYIGAARFTGERTLTVDTDDGPVDIAAEQVVIAAGGRPVVPPPVRDSGVPYETSDTIMRIDAPPQRLAVLGGGYIAAELAEVFAAMGSRVTIIEQQEALLGPQDEIVSREFTELAGRKFDLRLGTSAIGVSGAPGAISVELDDGSTVDADMLLVVVGRAPNGDTLDLAKAGVDTHDDGRIVVDAQQRTTAAGVFALGDVCTPVPLKHVANREAAVVKHNLLHPDELMETDHRAIPAAVFTQPQIATVGLTEQECREQGLDYVVGLQRFSDVAYGWALEDTTGFCKVLAERDTHRLLGAHLMGPQAATLIQPIVLAMQLGVDARTLATAPYWIHPALTEVVENALRNLGFQAGVTR